MRPVNITIVMSAHGYDTGCPNYKKHTYEFCSGYSLGYNTKWNWLTGETTTQQQTQSQAQGGPNMRIDGSHINVVITTRRTEDQAASSSSDSDSESREYGNKNGLGKSIDNKKIDGNQLISILVGLCRCCLNRAKLYCRSERIDNNPSLLDFIVLKMENVHSYGFKFLIGSGDATKFLFLCAFHNKS